MNQRMSLVWVLGVALVVATLLTPRLASAQVTPAAGSTPPDDTPSIRLGTTIFPNFTYPTEPKIADRRMSGRRCGLGWITWRARPVIPIRSA